MVTLSTKKEAIGGLTTFLTMAYIIVVNPAILSSGTGMPATGVLTATVLLCFLMTLLMGAYAKLPFAVAPGMGINAFFTYNIVLGKGVPWPVALGMVFWSGVLFLLVSLTPLRETLAKAIPHHLRIAAACGIGLFIAFIGLKNGHVIVPNSETLVAMGPLSLPSIFTIGGFLMMMILHQRRSAVAFMLPVVIISVTGYLMGLVPMPDRLVSPPDFDSVFFKLNIVDALSWALLPTVISIFFTDLFDSISTFVGVSQSTGLVTDSGEPKRLKQGLIVDALATLFAALFGTSSGTAYIESAAGIEAGARTGLASVITAFCFLPFLFVGPLVAAIPDFATAPVLLAIGALMFKSVLALKTTRLEEIAPVFITVIMIPMTFSITQGMLWGFIFHTIFYVAVGRYKEITKTMAAVSLLSLLLITLEYGPWK